MTYYFHMKTPKIIQKEICAECGGREKFFCHLPKKGPSDNYHHKFEPRLETRIEAAYRQGYEDGSRETADKIHWGESWG